MVKKRLIPVLILEDGNIVQSEQFNHTNRIHSQPEIAVDYFNRWAADELVILDVSRNRDNRDEFYKAIEKFSEKCFVPITAGGWVQDKREIRKLLRLGADKVAINTQAVHDPSFVTSSSKTFGSQCIVCSIDAKINDNQKYEVFIDRGRESTGMNPFDWAREVEQLGAGEIYITSIDHDGNREGYDENLIGGVVDAVDIPVIAFGGVSEWDHLVRGIELGAEAVAAANRFHYTEHSVAKAKDHLRKEGVDVR